MANVSVRLDDAYVRAIDALILELSNISRGDVIRTALYEYFISRKIDIDWIFRQVPQTNKARRRKSRLRLQAEARRN